MRSPPTTSTKSSSSFFSLRRRNSTTVANKKTAAPQLQRLLKKKNFGMICTCLEDPTISTDAWFKMNYSMIGENCLHILMRHRPPANIVEMMLKEYRAVHGEQDDRPPEHTQDLLGRTPLHIAVAYLCTPDAIEVLLSSNSGKQAVRSLDMRNRLPLHLAVISSNELLVEVSAKRKVSAKELSNLITEDIEAISQVNIELLMAQWPEALLVRDSLGLTPLHYTSEMASMKNDELIFSMKLKCADIRKEQDGEHSSIHGRIGRAVEIPLAISVFDGDLNYSVSSVSMTAVLAEEREGVVPSWPSQ